NLGMAKFSRFVTEAAQRGLLKLTKLENGQMEVDAAGEGAAAAAPAAPRASAPNGLTEERANGTEETARRGRRGRGRGRDRNRGAPAPAAARDAHLAPPMAEPVPASIVRRAARELLGRDSESLNERFFHRILRDAHDAERIDLRLHGEDYEVAPAAARAAAAAPAAPAADAATDASQAQRSVANAASLRRGMRHRGLRTSRAGELPPDLFSVGVVGLTPAEPEAAPEPVAEAAPEAGTEAAAETAPARRPRGRRGGKSGARTRGK